ncbi:vacuolar-sorting protein SNF8 isoform X2 [Apteryx rowi]|uniref:vacuolar-sorting protein SNF8 isoform X2 n=1 Tax=Apteryx rowi TaxID=308060 RepID=UPI000E1C696C|nr:vacuolar-sorting protein SNF8 isoform X2 [Apteryx rowi]
MTSGGARRGRRGRDAPAGGGRGRHRQEEARGGEVQGARDGAGRRPAGPAGKGFWSEMLGVGDFYYELGVQIIEVCLALKHRNGGLITLEELHQQVLKGRGKFAQDVSQDDLLRAIKKLKVLGNGFGIIPVGGTYLIQSVPAELNMDHTVVLQLAEKKGYVTVSEIKSSLKWETERAKQVLEHLLKEGMAWLDTQAAGDPQYWLPALFTELYSQEITPEEAKEAIP